MNDISIPDAENRVPETEPGSWDAVVEAIDAYTEAEGIVTEGWLLAVEQPVGPAVWMSKDSPRVLVFGSQGITDPHAVGMLDYARDRIRSVGVEG